MDDVVGRGWGRESILERGTKLGGRLGLSFVEGTQGSGRKHQCLLDFVRFLPILDALKGCDLLFFNGGGGGTVGGAETPGVDADGVRARSNSECKLPFSKQSLDFQSDLLFGLSKGFSLIVEGAR